MNLLINAVVEPPSRSLTSYRHDSTVHSETVGSMTRGRRGMTPWSSSQTVRDTGLWGMMVASRSISETQGSSIDPLRLL
jgi:hypothetical protein